MRLPVRGRCSFCSEQVEQTGRAFEERLSRIAEHTAHTERLIGDVRLLPAEPR